MPKFLKESIKKKNGISSGVGDLHQKNASVGGLWIFIFLEKHSE